MTGRPDPQVADAGVGPPDEDRAAQAPEFEEQALSHLDALYRTALRMTHNQQDAEDLVQETYLKAFRFADTYRHDTNLRAWLFRILTTSAINRYTRAARAPASESLDGVDEHALYQGLRALGGRFEPGAEDEVLNTLVDEEVRHALDTLPVQFRIAVLLADVEGFSYKEIAEITGVRLGTVMSRISRGRKLLHQALWSYARDRGLIASVDAPRREAASRAALSSS